MNVSDLTNLLREDDEIIIDRLDHWAAVAGDRPFVHYGEDDVLITYAEFGRRTDSIAGNLVRQGINKGDKISVFCKNPMASALIMFGIWKAGAVYCPINFAYSGRLLSYQLNDTGPRLIFTEPSLLPVLNAVAPDVHCPPAVVVYQASAGAHDHCPTYAPLAEPYVNVAWSEMIAEIERPAVSVSFDDPANVIYTSGTTGPAKGVVQPHRWLAQYTFALRLPLTTDDVIYNDLPMYHVGGAIANVARAAWVGCEVSLWNRFSPNDFWKRVASRGVTAAILLDVMIPWLAKTTPSTSDRSNTLNKVYLQPLPLHHHEFCRRFGIDFAAAGFGQTEAGAPLLALIEEASPGEGTPEALYRGLTHDQLKERAAKYGVAVLPGASVTRKGLMGGPSPFVEVSIRNETDEECAIGETGELALRSKLPSLFLIEYLGKPEATARAFRNTWFHTGDIAVQEEDGHFYFVDRLGDRLRVRGENLSSFQVEDMFGQSEKIQFCVVFAVPSDEGDEDDLVAYIVAADGYHDLVEQEVREYATACMPKFMHPRHIRIVDEIPRTPTNKIEKYKLRQQILAELSNLSPGRSG